MKAVRKNIGMAVFTLLAVALVVAVVHLAGQATGTPDQVRRGTATYNPWSAAPAAVVSTHTATATPDSGAGEPEDGGADGGGDG